MAEVSEVRRRRLVNPGRKKRKLSALQKLFFGSKRQRAAVKANKSRKRNISIRRTKKTLTNRYARVLKHVPKKHRGKTVSGMMRSVVRKRRKRNVGSIVTVLPMNPGRKKRKVIRNRKGVITMAKRRKARKHNVVYRKRIKRGMYAYSSNPGRRRRRRTTKSVTVRRRRSTRRSNPSIRRHRRRNPGFSGGSFMSGTGGSVLGVLAGVGATKVLSGFLPAQFQSGLLGYAGIAAVAVAQGKLVGKVTKNTSFGNHMMVGGLAFLVAKILNDFMPSIGAYSGISGMGLIGGSSFYNPQVNQGGNMGSFVVPSAVSGAIPMAAPRAGVGSMRRTGRLM
jgi:hypothetical protein